MIIECQEKCYEGLLKRKMFTQLIFRLYITCTSGHIKGYPLLHAFANDIVLVKELRDYQFELWKYILKTKSLCLSRSKKEYMYCNFSKR
ncbi:hypothetical protein CR513_49300, partial [Mucuna pruriens]